MFAEFILRAGLAGLALTVATGPLGSMLLWRRMAYFGDAAAHGALLGIVLAIASNLPMALGVIVIALAIGLGVSALKRREQGADVVLIVLAYSALALGLVLASLGPARSVPLEAMLFGDILAVSWNEVAFIALGAVAVLCLLLWRWERLILTALSPDLAMADKINPKIEERALTIALALAVAAAIQVVGALLIAAMLVIPAAAARALSHSPEQMALIASLIGASSILGGLAFSLFADATTGPSIICTAALIFGIIRLTRPSA